MEPQPGETSTPQLISNDTGEYIYQVKPFDFTNALGAVVATLQEYSITDKQDQLYKLYKTKDGTWYDIPGANPARANGILLSLKLAIRTHEKSFL